MTGISQAGAQTQLNALTNYGVTVVASSAPPGIVGGTWINTSSGNSVNSWNGSAWVANTNPYLALLTADPTGLSSISALSECADSGYSRVQVAFGAATAAYPSVSSNTSLITFGPFSVNMSLPVQWLALVSISSGTTGLLLNSWTVSSPQQVSATQTINIAAGALQITQS
jgi:hypothetical protein